MTQAQRLKLIEAAAFSVGDTLTAPEAISLIASLFPPDSGVRINRDRLAVLLNVVTPPRRLKARR